MAKTKFNKSKKYLTAEEFIEHCKANNVETSLDALEAYEKVGLLLPIYRLIVPDEYIRSLFEYNHRNHFYPDVPFDIDNKWQAIEQLRTDLSQYSFKPLPQFAFALIHGHPLDYTYQNKNPFLQKPSKKTFKLWSEYKIVVETINGDSIKEDTAEHYYTPWQIFVLDELNLMNTIEENYATKQKKGWGILKKELQPTKLVSFFEYFQTISNFRMMESLIWHDTTFDVSSMVIEGELYKQLITRTIAQAKKEYEKHSYPEWIKFIRKLTELHTRYTEREKIRLSDECKRFLTSTINMIIDATKKSFEKICSDYKGRFKKCMGLCMEDDVFFYPSALESIYPDRFAQDKEKAKWSFKYQIKQFNKTCPDNLKIEETIIDSLIDDIIESGHHLLLSHLREIEELWFNRTPRWESSIWAHLRSFTISIESIGSEWFKEKYLSEILEHAFKKEYTKLRDSINKRITDAKTPTEYKQKLAKIWACKKDHICGICSYHLVSTHLTRNYLSHKIILEPDMLGSLFIEVYRDLLFTLISLFIKKMNLLNL